MRKRLISTPKQPSPPSDAWLDLQRLATVEVTSEDADYSIESALVSDQDEGWRSAEAGTQLVRIVFDKPQSIRRIWLRFVETGVERTQEFSLRWSTDDGPPYREIRRQQWSFSPSGATSEVEDCRVELAGVTTIELEIKPDISGGESLASLARLRLA